VRDLVHLIVPERAALALDITDELDIRGGCTAVVTAVARAFDSVSLKGA